MLRPVKDLTNLQAAAAGEHVGKLEQLYFDDTNWAVRYLVIATGGLFTPRRVLVSPAAVEKVTVEAVLLKGTREQIENSPDVDTSKPVSRLKEEQLHNYYAWPHYWLYPPHYNSLGGAIYPGLTFLDGFPFSDENGGMAPEDVAGQRELEEEAEKSHLRSTKEVTGYHIQSTDETFGHISDFIVDDHDWVIRYCVIDTRNLLPGGKVLLAPHWIKGIDWAEAVVYVKVSGDTIRNGPHYDPSAPIDREFENRLYSYYGGPKYWA